MKKILFISNITKKYTNFSIPSIEASGVLGYEFHLAADLSAFNDDVSKYPVKLHHISLERNPFNIKNFIAYKQICTLIERENFDAIHCNTPIGGLLGRICGKRMKVRKVIYTAHGFHFQEEVKSLKNKLYYLIEKYLARMTDAIITINEEDFEAAKKFSLKEKGSIHYTPGVGVDTFSIIKTKGKRKELINSLGIPVNSTLMMSIGELNTNKNIEVVLKAMNELKNSNLHYIVCGVGPNQIQLEKLSKRHGLNQNVHFVGYRSDIVALLKSVDFFVLSSHREGLSRAIMEAMSAGLPVIVSRIRGNVDLVIDKKGGYTCNPKDFVCFSKAIKTLCEEPELRNLMGGFNKERIKNFDIKNVKSKIFKIYNEVLT